MMRLGVKQWQQGKIGLNDASTPSLKNVQMNSVDLTFIEYETVRSEGCAVRARARARARARP